MEDGIFELSDGTKFARFNTARNGEFANRLVESGSIGCILWAEIKPPVYDVDILPYKVKFITDYTCDSFRYNLRFGHFEIDTMTRTKVNHLKGN